jgi:hypothetical protein
LHDVIERELISHEVDAVSPADHAAAIKNVHEEYEDCVDFNTHLHLQNHFDALQDKYDQLAIDWSAVRSELVKENNELCRQRDKLAAQVLVMKRKLKDATRT